MFGFAYLKAPTTMYVLRYKGGRLVSEGPGLSFFYFAPFEVIAQVPISSVDVPFVFTELSQDFQEITVQGNLTYRVVNPKELAGLLDYTIDSRGRWKTEDPAKLNDRLVHATQARSKSFVQQRPMREVLASTTALTSELLEGLRNTPTLTKWGIEVLDVVVLAIRANPEMTKALEAEAREQLLKQADEAVYARRNVAVELERTIRENELKTELLVENKQREIRQTKMDADIAVEKQRTDLVASKADNDRREAEGKAAGLRAILEPVKDVDWRTLVAATGGGDSKTIMSMAFEQLSQKADKIGQLNITPDLLSQLIQRD